MSHDDPLSPQFWEQPKEEKSDIRSVTRDEEFRRIEALPRRVGPTVRIEALSALLRTPEGAAAGAQLLLEQAWLLTELYDNAVSGVGGAVGMFPVGKGKTIPTLVGGTLLQAQRPILLVPAGLKRKTEVEIVHYRKHWRVHPNLKILSNQMLQILENKDMLRLYMPDVIFIDEAHEYKNPSAARTIRLLEYCRDFPQTIVVVLSGTLIKDSIRNYAHLMAIVFPRRRLRDGRIWSMSPVPYYKSRSCEEWSRALDENTPDSKRIAPGALRSFVQGQESVREAVARRMYELPGVVAPESKEDCAASLNIFQRAAPPVPEVIRQSFALMRQSGATISGDQMTDRFSVQRRFQEIIFGFYRRWIWPNNTPDAEWIETRKAWRKSIRHILKYNRQGLDSVKAVELAVEAGQFGPDVLQQMYAWLEIKKRYPPRGQPPQEIVWLSDYILKDAAKFKGLIWVEHPVLGERLAQMTGYPYFGAGDDRIIEYRGGPCIASIHAHRKGHNLQDRYRDALYLCMPANSEMWEQSIGRIHRRGQEADEVRIYVYMHCIELWESFEGAMSEAVYIKESSRQSQKLLTATKALLTADEVVAKLSSGDSLWGRVAG